jgi:tRNA(fMet)-specific endonuclease VapC
LLAGQAMHHNMTVITANTTEFSRVKGLKWEDWS